MACAAEKDYEWVIKGNDGLLEGDTDHIPTNKFLTQFAQGMAFFKEHGKLEGELGKEIVEEVWNSQVYCDPHPKSHQLI